MKFIVLSAFLLAACGTADKNSPSDGQNKQSDGPNEASPTADTPQKENATEAVYAIALETPAELPTCAAGNEKQLAYVKSEAKFYSCESDGWDVLTLAAKGDKGDAGAQGPQGAEGPKGDKGDTGLPGNSNTWYDVQTDHTWMIGGGVHFADAQGICSNGWRMPDSTEGVKARQDGIANASSMWVSDNDTTGGEAYIISGTNISSKTSVATSSTYTVACIKTTP
jgi:hypothetical protein